MYPLHCIKCRLPVFHQCVFSNNPRYFFFKANLVLQTVQGGQQRWVQSYLLDPTELSPMAFSKGEHQQTGLYRAFGFDRLKAFDKSYDQVIKHLWFW